MKSEAEGYNKNPIDVIIEKIDKIVMIIFFKEIDSYAVIKLL